MIVEALAAFGAWCIVTFFVAVVWAVLRAGPRKSPYYKDQKDE